MKEKQKQETDRDVIERLLRKFQRRVDKAVKEGNVVKSAEYGIVVDDLRNLLNYVLL